MDKRPLVPLNIYESESESHSVVSDSLQPPGLYSPWNSPGQNTGIGSLSLLRRIFPTQGLYPGLLHCRRLLYQLSHKGSLRKLEWVVYPFSSGSSSYIYKPKLYIATHILYGKIYRYMSLSIERHEY